MLLKILQTEKHLCRSLFFNKVAGWKLETVRSSQWRCSVKRGVFKNFANFTGKNLFWSLFLVAVLRACNFIEEDSDTCVPAKFANFLRTVILKNIREHLLLNFI